MNQQSAKSINLMTFVDLKYCELEADVERLRKGLAHLEQGERLTSCYAYEIFNLVSTDLAVLIEALELATNAEPDLDLCDSLQERCEALRMLLAEVDKLSTQYLYCPMKDNIKA